MQGEGKEGKVSLELRVGMGAGANIHGGREAVDGAMK